MLQHAASSFDAGRLACALHWDADGDFLVFLDLVKIHMERFAGQYVVLHRLQERQVLCALDVQVHQQIFGGRPVHHALEVFQVQFQGRWLGCAAIDHRWNAPVSASLVPCAPSGRFPWISCQCYRFHTKK